MFRMRISGGTVMPFFTSAWRWPRTCRSIVSTSAEHFAAAARSISAAHKAAVLHHIELEPEWLRHCRRHILDRADRHGGERERDADRLRRAAGEDLAIAPLHSAQPDRRQRERQRGRLADDRGRQVALRYIDEHALAQLDLFEVGRVRAQRFLGVGAAVGVFEEHLRHAGACALPQVLRIEVRVSMLMTST